MGDRGWGVAQGLRQHPNTGDENNCRFGPKPTTIIVPGVRGVLIWGTWAGFGARLEAAPEHRE